MFTGIIEALGSVSQIERASGGARLNVTTDMDMSSDRIGDSVAVNGICLTIVEITTNSFALDLSQETIGRTTFEEMKVGDKVNLERALKFSGRLGGHLVTGHIDGVGVVRRRTRSGASEVFEITAPSGMERYMIEKGSIAVDGISLTINSCQGRDFSVNIIPHTLSVTTLGLHMSGSRVNIEADVLGKYIERIMSGGKAGGSGDIDLELLAKHGFLKDR